MFFNILNCYLECFSTFSFDCLLGNKLQCISILTEINNKTLFKGIFILMNNLSNLVYYKVDLHAELGKVS